MDIDRRTLLVGSLSALLAGCTGDGDGDADASATATGESGSTATASPESDAASRAEETPTPMPGTQTPTPTGSTEVSTAETPTATETATAGGDDLDLREANVTAVEFERDGDTVGFDVTLFHDDDGEGGYANWWQVETLGGEQLGRRKLLHAHGTRRFTRSDSVEVPEGVTCVVVRGHDQTHEYGGQAMLVNLASGATAARRQGADRQSFEESDCP